jgi:predicted phosphodiesterase
LKYGKKLALVRGNHDWKPSGENRYSSFDLITSILKQHFPEQVTVASTVTEWKQFVLVPHLANSDILNLEISKLKDVSNKVVVFHANVGNFFAAETQHSLNLTMEQVEDLVSRDNLVIFGHEHQYRSLVSGRCVVLGNTAPSSIADCIGSPFKYAAIVSGTEYELIPAWDHLNSYIEADWRDLTNIDGYNFIRVVGNATALEAAAVIKAVSQLRQRSEAFVITNSVRVEGQDMTMNTESIESIKAFDVMGAIYAELNEREIETVKELMKC